MTTQYIGSRYVPLLADPVEWSSTKTYEPLTIVTHEGNSYTSRQFVPVGVDIANEQFWALTGNYNAQVEQYRRETAQMVENFDTFTTDITRQFDEFSDSVTEEIQNIAAPIDVSVRDGVDNTGVDDSTVGIQNVIDNAPIGATLLFKNGVYRFSTLNLKSGINYDFNGSSLICTDVNTVALKATGELVSQTRMSEDYNPNQSYIRVRRTTDIEVGQLVFIKSTDLAHQARNYYYKGFVSVVTDIVGDAVYIADVVPYSISMGTTDVYFYNAANNITVKNISNIEFVGNINNSTDFLMLEYCINSSVENISVKSTIAHWIDIRHSVNCKVDNCHIYSPNNPYGLSLTYFIVISSSTNTIVNNCTSNFMWHGATTGYQETALNTIIQNCVFNTPNTGTYGYADHENAIGTTLINVKSNAPIDVTAANSFIDTCVASYFRVTGHSNKDLANCQLNNCIAIMNQDTTVIAQAIAVQTSPQTSYNVYYTGLVINNFVSMQPACINFDNVPIYLQVSNSRNLFFHKQSGSGVNCYIKFTNCYFKFTKAFRTAIPNIKLGSGYTSIDFIGCTFDCSECNINQSLNVSTTHLNISDCTWISNAATSAPMFYFALTDNTFMKLNNVTYVGNFSVAKPMFVAQNTIASAIILICNSQISTSGFKNNIASNVLISNSLVNSGGFYSYYGVGGLQLLETLPAQYNESSIYKQVERDF